MDMYSLYSDCFLKNLNWKNNLLTVADTKPHWFLCKYMYCTVHHLPQAYVLRGKKNPKHLVLKVGFALRPQLQMKSVQVNI